MGFGPTQLDGSSTPIPMACVVPDGTTNPVAIAGGPSYTDSGNTKAPAAYWVKDGNDQTQGVTTDAAVVGDNNGTISAKLRGLTKIFNDVWDSVNHLFAMNVKQVGGTATDTNSGNKSAGTQRVVLATDQPTMTNPQPVSQNGTWTVQPGNTPNTTPWLVQDVVASSGGEVPYHNLSAASANFTNVKSAATQMYDYALSNTSGSTIFVKFYDKATVPGTSDVPKRTVQVPTNGTVIQTIPKGMKFVNGFGWAATGAVADNDNTNIAANCVIDFSLNS